MVPTRSKSRAHLPTIYSLIRGEYLMTRLQPFTFDHGKMAPASFAAALGSSTVLQFVVLLDI